MSESTDSSLVTSILTAQIFKGKNSVYLGPRKFDDSPQATFHYGDGKWAMQFHYIKDGKAAERGGSSGSTTNPEDKKDKQKLGDYNSQADGGTAVG